MRETNLELLETAVSLEQAYILIARKLDLLMDADDEQIDLRLVTIPQVLLMRRVVEDIEHMGRNLN